MSDGLREAVLEIYRAAVARVHAGRLVAEHLNVAPDGTLAVGGRTFDASSGVYLIALGKAAQGMARAAEERLGEHVAAGIVVTKSSDPLVSCRSTVIESSHPVPDERSIAAGAAVLDFAAHIPERSIVLCLISGGGSALVEALRPGVTLQELRDLTDRLLRAGASIRELNAVRGRLSDIKAGGLLERLRGRQVVNLIVSDVLGDDLHAIASGPTVAAPRNTDAEAVLRRYAIRAALPPRRAQDTATEAYSLIIGNLELAVREAAAMAESLGYAPLRLTQSLDAEARDVARTLAGIVVDARGSRSSLPSRGLCLLAGGETVVTVRGDGVGGRNLEGALAAALRLEGIDRVAMGFLATDGDDGGSGLAGAVVTGATIDDDNRSEALEALRRNDSWGFFRDRVERVQTGPTGTNVNDLVIAVLAHGRPG